MGRWSGQTLCVNTCPSPLNPILKPRSMLVREEQLQWVAPLPMAAYHIFTPWRHCLRCSGLWCLRSQFPRSLAAHPYLYGSCISPWLWLRCPSLHPQWWKPEQQHEHRTVVLSKMLNTTNRKLIVLSVMCCVVWIWSKFAKCCTLSKICFLNLLEFCLLACCFLKGQLQYS